MSTDVDTAATALLQRTNPLAVGREVDCGGLIVPAATVALPGGAERGPTPESAALRAFLADNPFAGMGSVGGTNWLQLGASDDLLVFGQRRGRLGVGPVVTLTRDGSGWTPTALGGCGLVRPGPGEQAAVVDGALRSGRSLRLRVQNGRGNDGVLVSLLVRVETVRDATGLHVLVVVRDNPAAGRGGWHAGVGVSSWAEVALSEALDPTVPVLDDARLPSHQVPTE